MKLKKTLSFFIVLALCLTLFPLGVHAVGGLSEADAREYKKIIDDKTAAGLVDVNSYMTDFDGDGRNELFLIWLAETNGMPAYLWKYQYEVWLGARRMTEGSFGYWAACSLCVDALGRSRLVCSVQDDGLEEHISNIEEYIRGGTWVTDTYELRTPVDYYDHTRTLPTEYSGPNGPVTQQEYEANVARLNGYERIHTFNVYDYFMVDPEPPRFFHSAWNEITAALYPGAFAWTDGTPDFDGTYWILTEGATLGTSFFVKMHADGTYDAISGAGNPEKGNYRWENGALIMAAASLRWNGSGFHADEDQQRWNGWPNGGFYVTLVPDPEKTYAKLTNEPVDDPTPEPSPPPQLEFPLMESRLTAEDAAVYASAITDRVLPQNKKVDSYLLDLNSDYNLDLLMIGLEYDAESQKYLDRLLVEAWFGSEKVLEVRFDHDVRMHSGGPFGTTILYAQYENTYFDDAGYKHTDHVCDRVGFTLDGSGLLTFTMETTEGRNSKEYRFLQGNKAITQGEYNEFVLECTSTPAEKEFILEDLRYEVLTTTPGHSAWDEIVAAIPGVQLPDPYQGIPVEVDGRFANFPDARPFIDENGRTLVPLRAVAEALGLEVKWDGSTRTASFSGTVTDENWSTYKARVDFQIGVPAAVVSYSLMSGEPIVRRDVSMDTVPVIVGNRTYAPVRYLAEAFGYTAEWNGLYRWVQLYSGKISPPDFPTLTLTDGSHVVSVRKNQIVRSADGSESVKVGILDTYSYTDDEVRSLSVGKTIMTPYGEMRIDSIRWYGDDLADLGSGTTLERGLLAKDKSLWAYCSGGIPVRYTVGYAAVQFSPGTPIYDDFTFLMTGSGAPHMRRNSLIEFFDAHPYHSDTELLLTVSGGLVTEATILYSP